MSLLTFSPDSVRVLGIRITITRGQIMMLMVSVNLAFLGLDIYLAHGLNGTIRPNEWIPIVFGPIAAVILLFAGIVSLQQKRLAVILAFLVLAVSLVVGLVGAYFHIQRAIPPGGVDSPDILLRFLVFAPPILGPLTFSLMTVLGIIAVVDENPPDSGVMIAPGLFKWRVPFSKSQQYYIWVGLGILVTLLSSVLDHGRFNFENPWVWLPTIVGVFAVATSITMGLIKEPSTSDVITFFISMVALIIVGVIGFALHIDTDMTGRGLIVVERFLRGAPFLAPMLFADMGTLGLIILWPVRAHNLPTESTAG